MTIVLVPRVCVLSAAEEPPGGFPFGLPAVSQEIPHLGHARVKVLGGAAAKVRREDLTARALEGRGEDLELALELRSRREEIVERGLEGVVGDLVAPLG